jgi:minor extracellular serine protease Vpr
MNFRSLFFIRRCLVPVVLAFVLPRGFAMDMARVETRVDDAVARFGVTGKGVLVAVMDRGIDWANNDFRNADGTTRIKYIFDLTDNAGASDPNNPYGYGTIYTEDDINSALTGGPPLATRDAIGHGTTTSGIACGNGRNSLNAQYRGVATNATLIMVKLVSDGAPAHDSQPAEAPFYDPSLIPVAIQFIKDKAGDLGMPCVMLMNFGSQEGPTDGTSALCQTIDSTVGPGKTGLIFLTGAGDDGGMANRAGGQIVQGGTNTLQIQKGEAGPLILNLWYGGADSLEVLIQTPDNVDGPFPALADNNDYFSYSDAEIAFYHYGANVNSYGSTNGRRQMYLELDGPVGTYSVGLIGDAIANGHFDATLNPSQIWNSSAANYFLNDVAPGSIWDGATAAYNICAADYVIRTNYTDIDGYPEFSGGYGGIGQMWQGSSVGPTFDGRLGVDVCLPGDSVFTTYAPNSYWATFRFNLIDDGYGLYGRASAVSAANPILTGIVALLLEMNPKLDAPAVKSILQRSARADAFTGAVPNPRWGYGKADAYSALALAAPVPAITSIGISGTNVQLNFTTTKGMKYRLDTTPGLNPINWTTITNGISGTGGILQAADHFVKGPAQSFYRVVMYP